MENTCALCGSNDVHACGDDFLCDICCTNIMGIPDELPYLFNWLDKVVLPYVISVKQGK
jgi:hypothetical protein